MHASVRGPTPNRRTPMTAARLQIVFMLIVMIPVLTYLAALVM